MSHDPTQTQPCEWRERFEALLAERMRQPFEWGEHDCCTWAADAVQAQTGYDPAKAWRGTYTDATGASRLVKRLGGMAAIGAMAGPEIPPLCACVGDVGLVVLDDRELLAVCVGHAWVAPANTGLAMRPFGEANKAWSVPRG